MDQSNMDTGSKETWDAFLDEIEDEESMFITYSDIKLQKAIANMNELSINASELATEVYESEDYGILNRFLRHLLLPTIRNEVSSDGEQSGTKVQSVENSVSEADKLHQLKSSHNTSILRFLNVPTLADIGLDNKNLFFFSNLLVLGPSSTLARFWKTPTRSRPVIR